MKILFISAEYSPQQGGVGDYTRALAIALAQQNHIVQIVTTLLPGAAERGFVAIPHLSDHSSDESQPIHEEIGRIEIIRPVARWGWASLPVLRRLVLAERPDVVNIEYQTGAYGMHPAINFLPLLLRGISYDDVLPVPRKTVKRRPLILNTFHDLRVPYLWPKAGRVRELANTLLLRYTGGVIATNARDFASIVQRGYGAKARLIPIGSNIEVKPPTAYTRKEWRAGHNIAPDVCLLVYFGFLNESKGVVTALRALALLRQKKSNGREYRLVIAGGQTGISDPTNEAYAQTLRREIERAQLEDALIWTGYIEPAEVSAWLLGADIAVLPFRDGAGFRRGSLLAALAHGMAIVTTLPSEGERAEIGPAGSAAEVAAAQGQLVAGVNVVMVEIDNADQLAEAISLLGEDPAQRQRLGDAARLLVERCDWSKIARELAEFCAIMARD